MSLYNADDAYNPPINPIPPPIKAINVSSNPLNSPILASYLENECSLPDFHFKL